MSITLLFVFGYLLGAIGSGVIVTEPLRRVMGFNDGRHADPETEGDAVLVLLAVIVGTAALWPIMIPLYYSARFKAAQLD